MVRVYRPRSDISLNSMLHCIDITYHDIASLPHMSFMVVFWLASLYVSGEGSLALAEAAGSFKPHALLHPLDQIIELYHHFKTAIPTLMHSLAFTFISTFLNAHSSLYFYL